VDIIAANTHLFFDPSFEEVKILQTALSLRHINRTVDKLNLNDAVVIFAGDLNCTPESEALTLIQGGSVNLVDRNNQENIISLTSNVSVFYICINSSKI
jgi:mRNA deadenylase 3'-5' endonuclease subunit Ccr4